MPRAWCNAVVHLNPYGEDAVRLAVDLANRPPNTPPELERRCVEAGLVVDRRGTAADLASVLDLLRTWCAVVDAPGPAARAALLNDLLAAATAHPRLTDHVGGWHLHFRDDGLPLSGVLRALIATGTALHLAGRGMDRLGRCTRPDCDRVYADLSRGGTQRYCAPSCANRDAVRRHRARAAAARARPARPQRARPPSEWVHPGADTIDNRPPGTGCLGPILAQEPGPSGGRRDRTPRRG